MVWFIPLWSLETPFFYPTGGLISPHLHFIYCVKRLRTATAQLGEQEAQWDLFSVHKYLKGESKEDGARLCSVVPTAKTRVTGHKLQHDKFLLNTRKHFCAVNTGIGCQLLTWCFHLMLFCRAQAQPDWMFHLTKFLFLLCCKSIGSIKY